MHEALLSVDCGAEEAKEQKARNPGDDEGVQIDRSLDVGEDGIVVFPQPTTVVGPINRSVWIRRQPAAPEEVWRERWPPDVQPTLSGSSPE